MRANGTISPYPILAIFAVSLGFVLTALSAASILPELTGRPGFFLSWLTRGESGSATLRNVGLLFLTLIGLPFAMWRTIVASRQADTAERALGTERYRTAVEMVGHGSLIVRLGGIDALHHLAKENPGQYHLQAMRLFCAFLRHSAATHVEGTGEATVSTNPTQLGPGGDVSARPDVEAVLRSIGSRDSREKAIEDGVGFEFIVSNADLRRVRMHEVFSLSYDARTFSLVDREPRKRANLSGIRFRYVDFSEANLSFVDMSGAEFWDPDLTGANLESSDLSRTSWEGGTMAQAQLSSIDLSNAHILETNLSGASLSSAKLAGAMFQEVDLSNADLSRADVSGTHFSLVMHNGALFDREYAKSIGIDPREHYVGVRGLTQAQIDKARADPANPPQVEGILDARTGKPIVWRGRSTLAVEERREVTGTEHRSVQTGV